MCRGFAGGLKITSLKIIWKCTALIFFYLILPMIGILKLPFFNEKMVVETNHLNYYLINFNLSSDSLFNFDDRQTNFAAWKEWSENRQPFWFYFFVLILNILNVKNNCY